MVTRSEGLLYDIGQGVSALDLQAQRDRLDGYAVVSGLKISEGAGLEVSAEAGEATVGLSGGSVVTVSPGSQTESIDAADSQYPRKDTVWIDDTGDLRTTAGVAEPALPDTNDRFDTFQPEPPAPSGDGTILAEVWVPAEATSLGTNDIRDRRQPAEVVGQTAYIEQLGQSVDADGNDLTGLGTLGASVANLSQLGQTLDANGQDVTGVGAFDSDSVVTEDLDISGSSFGVTGATLTAIIDSEHGSERNQQVTEDVSTSAVEIWDGRAGDLNPKGLFVAVYGEDGNANRFTELLLDPGGGGVVVVGSADRGSPTGRSYTQSTNAISLAMASDTYDVVAEGVGLGVDRA